MAKITFKTHLMPSNTRKLLLLGASSVVLTGFCAAAHVTMSASIDGFFDPDPSNFQLIPGDSNLEFRYTTLTAPDGANESTHILIEGLVPVGSSTSTLASRYVGIDSSDGSEYDSGVVYLDLGQALPNDVAAGPIVGIAPRAGGWDEAEDTQTAGPLAGAVGTVTFDDADDSGMMDFSFDVDGTTYTGSAPYDLVSASEIAVDPVTLSGGGNSVDLLGFTLMEWMGLWYTVVETDSAEFDGLMYELTVSGGVPAWGGFVDLPGDGAWYSWHFKYVFEGVAGNGQLSGQFNTYWIQDLNRWVFFDTNSGTGSIDGFWMYVYNMPGVGGNSWVYTGGGGWGLTSLEPSGGYDDLEFFMYAAANDTYYFFTEYEDTGDYGDPAEAGNYFSTFGANAEYFKVQEPINDSTGVEIPDDQLPAPLPPEA
ncbi:MAG: hypothetical protein ACLFU2_03365 [Opitutales bacterium]